MSFVSYSHLILLISDQMFKVTIAHEKIWELNGLDAGLADFGFEIAAQTQRGQISGRKTQNSTNLRSRVWSSTLKF